jgi:hypothetical protein
LATPTLSIQNWYETTLSSGIASTDTTIPLNVVPTPSEGYLVIEPDSSTNREVIYYNSKTGSGVIAPSAALGRGVDGTTGIAHSSGATVRMQITKGQFDSLQDGTALTGLHTNNTDSQFDYVASGCVWSADAAGSTRNGSMTSGVVRINGRRFTVASVSAHSFTASKDTYVDVLYSATDNTGTVVYTEANNNAASPSLASNSIRIGIVVTAAGSIAAAASINQGQEDRILPIVSSVPYAVTDSLGNLICPRDPQRKLLGYRQILANFTTSSASDVAVTGLSLPVIVPANRKVKVTAFSGQVFGSVGADTVTAGIYEAAAISTLTTRLQAATNTSNQAGVNLMPEVIYTPSSTTRFYTVSVANSASHSTTFQAASGQPAWIKVELF